MAAYMNSAAPARIAANTHLFMVDIPVLLPSRVTGRSAEGRVARLGTLLTRPGRALQCPGSAGRRRSGTVKIRFG